MVQSWWQGDVSLWEFTHSPRGNSTTSSAVR